MKKAMRQQQAMALRTLYADLIKQLGLSPDAAENLMTMLADRQMAMTEKGMALMGGKADAKQIAEAGDASGAYDGKLEALLGADGYGQFKDYERTLGDRTMMQQYQQLFTANGAALDDSQSAGLLQIMIDIDERAKSPPSPFSTPNANPADQMQALQSNQAMHDFSGQPGGLQCPRVQSRRSRPESRSADGVSKNSTANDGHADGGHEDGTGDDERAVKSQVSGSRSCVSTLGVEWERSLNLAVDFGGGSRKERRESERAGRKLNRRAVFSFRHSFSDSTFYCYSALVTPFLAMTKSEITLRLLDPGIIAILRTDSSDQLVAVSEALAEGGITAIEVTMTTPVPYKSSPRLRRDPRGEDLNGRGHGPRSGDLPGGHPRG